METFRCRSGNSPLLVSIPHAGTQLPEDMTLRMTTPALALPDTDWHVDVLYDFLDVLDATVLVAAHARFVIDLNRPPDSAPLYPGQLETGLCPTMTFDGEPIYREKEPDAKEIQQRRELFWQPYHDRLRQELDRLRAHHEQVVLWDAHSIRSTVPELFAGQLPVLNFGTHSGRACSKMLSDLLFTTASRTPDYPAVLNGRFTGGYITREYGDPDHGIHAVQLELAQRSYMREMPPYTFEPDKAAEIRPVLKSLLNAALTWCGC